MPVYCIKTADIPAEELSQWHNIGYSLESNDLKESTSKQAWINYWFGGEYLYIVPEEIALLLSTYEPPKQPYLPLTLSILKQLAFLKLTGDCNDSNNTLQIFTST